MYRGTVVSIGAGVYQHELDQIRLEDPTHFGFRITVVFGIIGTDFTELVGTTVCSPSWFESHFVDKAVIRGGEIVFMRKYDAADLAQALHNFASSCRSKTTAEVFLKLSRIGYSEWQDYNEPGSLRQYLDTTDIDKFIPLQRIDHDGRVQG